LTVSVIEVVENSPYWYREGRVRVTRNRNSGWRYRRTSDIAAAAARDPKRHLHEPLRGLESKRLARDDKMACGSVFIPGREADRRNLRQTW